MSRHRTPARGGWVARQWVWLVAAGVVVSGAGAAALASGGGGDEAKPVLITSEVQRRDLRDEVTVQGTLGRVEERTISAPAMSSGNSSSGGGGGGGGVTVSSVYVKDGATMQANQAILALEGRDSITQVGDLAFFRKLDVGATGVDVRQLEQILAAEGYSPGKVDLLFTEQTRFALAQWQAAHGYPGANPSTPQTVTVALAQGSGYKVGERSSAAATIGPYVPPSRSGWRSPGSAASSMPARTGEAASRSLATATGTAAAARVGAFLPCPPATLPRVTITASATTVAEGGSVNVTLTGTPIDPTCVTQVAVTTTGSAVGGSDYQTFSQAVTLDASGSASFPLQTLTDNVAENDEIVNIWVVDAQNDSYIVGSPNSVSITITDPAGGIPTLTLTRGSGRVPEGQPAQFTVGLDRQVSSSLTVGLVYGGDAVDGEDYNRPAGSISVPTGVTSFAVTIATLDDDVVEPDKTLTVALAASSAYDIGSPSGGSVVIVSDDVPKVEVVGGGGVTRGGGAAFRIVADQAPIRDTTVQYQVTGTAKQGVDISPLTGTVMLRAGTTSANVPLLTLNTDVVFYPTDMIVAHWPTRIGHTLVEEGDLAPPGTPLFSITETGFTVTLKASAADRSKLEVGQQVTVELQGGDGSAPGVITKLDESVTVNEQTKERYYEGKVQVQGDLGAADGAPVTIDVVLEERLGVLTVPIAAVKQNGEGKDVVRVIDLRRGGKLREVEVTTGLTEGSFIEIKKGLQGDEVVVVEVEQGSGG